MCHFGRGAFPAERPARTTSGGPRNDHRSGRLVIGVAFGIDGRRSARKTAQELDDVLQAIRAGNPAATQELGVELAGQGELPGGLSGTSERARLDREKEALADAIAQLPEREKLVVTLNYYEELSYEEIAEVLGVTTKEVDSLLQRAFWHLRERMEDTGL
jgi:RNA polymerase sigma factor for flagellar operon FliA